ncbi:MAG: FprA family A-type flavoprotein, partial [Muribaculaceae bacterium]|nr:FprA family A-type flavoprotein [Muribaculaceae bacterium]
REKTKFDGIYELPMGVSYNSYVVSGPDATAIIDGSDAAHANAYIRKLEGILGDRKPDYIIVNHAEPDHTGALPMVRLRWPDIKVVGNAKTFDLLKGYYGITDNLVEVKEGSTISLGGDCVLQFIMTPMLHWPETMMTYLACDGVLFSGDAFGCFGALDGAIIDDEMDDVERYYPEAERYYACIVAKYGLFVLKAYAKLQKIDINYICTTHGPVWHAKKTDIVELYLRMAGWNARKGVVIVYGSMYGATSKMAEELAACLVDEGVRDIRVHDVTLTPLSFILADVMRFDSLVLISPTYNTDIYPPMESLAHALVERGVQRRRIGLLGSYSWGGQSVRKLREVLAPLAKDCTMLESSAEMRQALIDGSVADISILAKDLK